jgi:hypothetical protein
MPERLRLLSLFIITQGGVKRTDRMRLTAAAELEPEDENVLLNLERLGYTLQTDGSPRPPLVDKAKRRASKARAKSCKTIQVSGIDDTF